MQGQEQRAHHLGIELEEVEEKGRGQGEACGQGRGQTRRSGRVLQQQEQGRDQGRSDRVPGEHGDREPARRSARAVDRAVDPEGGREQDRGARRQDVVDAALLAADRLARDLRGAYGRGAPGRGSAQHRAREVRRLARDGRDCPSQGGAHRHGLKLLHGRAHPLGVQAQLVADRHGLTQVLGLVPGVPFPVAGRFGGQ